MNKELPSRRALAPLERSSTVKEVEGRLRREILDGAFSLGAPLRESVLALELRVSRNTLREALRSLVANGLAQYHPDLGFSVAAPDATAVEEILHLRGWLEQLATARSIATIRQHVPELRRAVDKMSRAARKSDWLALYDADLYFHSTIVAALGSPRLDRFHRLLWEELQLIILMHDRDRETGNTYDDRKPHEALVRAFESGSVPRACSEIVTHMAGTAKMLGVSNQPDIPLFAPKPTHSFSRRVAGVSARTKSQ